MLGEAKVQVNLGKISVSKINSFATSMKYIFL